MSDTAIVAGATLGAAFLTGLPATWAAVTARRNRALIHRLLRIERYIHRRNHDIMEDLFKLSLMLWIVMQHFDINAGNRMPQPHRREPLDGEWEIDEERDDDLDGPLFKGE